MSLVSSLLCKPKEMPQLQQVAQAVQKKSSGETSVSNLFVNQQTDHSRYIRAAIKSSEAIRSAMDNKMGSMTSLLQAQMDYEENNHMGKLDLSYSRRARIGARSGQLVMLEQNSKVHEGNDTTSENGRIENRAAELANSVGSPVSRALIGASGYTGHKVSMRSTAKISIKV